MNLGYPGLIFDLGIRGVWQPQVEVLFDISSHSHGVPDAILESNLQEKKRIYKKAVEDIEEVPSHHLSF